MKYIYSIIFLVLFFACVDKVSLTSYDKSILDKYVLEEFPDMVLESSIPIQDDSAAVYLGFNFFHMATSAQGVSCGTCHSVKKGGAPLERDPFGNGEFDQVYKWTVEWLYPDLNYDIPLDLQPLITPDVANGKYRNLVLSDGFKTNLPFEFQSVKGADAHMFEGMVLEANKNVVFRDLANLAYGNSDINQEIINCALSAFQQTITTANSNVNKYARGEAPMGFRWNGLELYDQHCFGCHNQDTMSLALGEFSIKDTINVPRLENFYNRVRVGNQYVVYHSKELRTPYMAIKDHEKLGIVLTQREKVDIINFMKYGLFDDEMERHFERWGD